MYHRHHWKRQTQGGLAMIHVMRLFLKTSYHFASLLKDTEARVVPYWADMIVPAIKEGKKVLIAAHGNSMRAIVKYLDKMSGEEIAKTNIPTGIPLGLRA